MHISALVALILLPILSYNFLNVKKIKVYIFHDCSLKWALMPKMQSWFAEVISNLSCLILVEMTAFFEYAMAHMSAALTKLFLNTVKYIDKKISRKIFIWIVLISPFVTFSLTEMIDTMICFIFIKTKLFQTFIRNKRINSFISFMWKFVK